MFGMVDCIKKLYRDKRRFSVIYTVHTGMSTDPRSNLQVEFLDEKTGFLVLSHWEENKRVATICTYTNKIERTIEVDEREEAQ